MHSSWKGGPLGFGRILLMGYLGLPENMGGPLFLSFIAFFEQIFQTLPPYSLLFACLTKIETIT
jgi:hypothetical protein